MPTFTQGSLNLLKVSCMADAPGHPHSGALISLFLRNCLNHSAEAVAGIMRDSRPAGWKLLRTKFFSRK